MKSDNKVIKIIFNLKGRTNNVVKYINLLSKNYNKNIVFDLLIINEKKRSTNSRTICKFKNYKFRIQFKKLKE